MPTPYHAQYWAHLLTLAGDPGDDASVGGISRSIASARVDLNPHQVDAALFAIRSPLSRGAILADEVGLGKTIEAGIVLLQRWAERRRRLLLVVPATLRAQWQQELAEKFGLPSEILDGPAWTAAVRAGRRNPFDQPGRVVLCSYQFAAARADELRRVGWDLAVLDEAHRLRNVHRPGSKTAQAIRDALDGVAKLLLTATPLQNSLLELYGLVTLLDPHVFGDERTFRARYVGRQDEESRNAELRARLAPLCTRTLRRQVQEYIRFTRRVPLTQAFTPSDAEQELTDLVTEYLRRETLLALPRGQRHLVELVLLKLLGSSTFAVAATLRRLADRLAVEGADDVLDAEDYDAIDELLDELSDGEEESRAGDGDAAPARRLADELAELRAYAERAEAIRQNAKGVALLEALRTGFDGLAALGAARKAVVFTESRRTQQYLLDLLTAHGYGGQIVLMNGTNADPASRAIHAAWTARHAGTGLASGSRAADVKAAIVEEFRDRATILLATESAAEGVNLQFCSLVVNYDLPWNPQRVEQRIGRCHRYGQRHDVLVVNFLNTRNAAEQRVLELMREKLRLFDGVFGASDEVLGALESGVDFERRIKEAILGCRTPDEIEASFRALRAELEEHVQARLLDTRRALLEDFDEEVAARLRVHRDRARAALDARQDRLLALTRAELAAEARFEADVPRFRYDGALAPAGHYHLDWREADRLGDAFYHEGHALAAAVIERARGRELPAATLALDLDAHGARVAALEPLRGRSGWLALARLGVASTDLTEFLVLAGCTDAGEPIDGERCEKLLALPARALAGVAGAPPAALDMERERLVAERRARIEARNRRAFDEEEAKLERWADDRRFALERELRELKKAIAEAKRAARAGATLEEKLAAQRRIKELEGEQRRRRRDLFDAEDEIERQRDALIAETEARLRPRDTLQAVFTVRWTLA